MRPVTAAITTNAEVVRRRPASAAFLNQVGCSVCVSETWTDPEKVKAVEEEDLRASGEHLH